MPDTRAIEAELRRLLEDVHPWIIDTKFTGSNWLVCSFGRSSIDDLDYHITTDSIRCSQYRADAKTDAEFIVAARKHLPALLDELERLRAENAELRAKSDSLDWLMDDA